MRKVVWVVGVGVQAVVVVVFVCTKEMRMGFLLWQWCFLPSDEAWMYLFLSCCEGVPGRRIDRLRVCFGEGRDKDGPRVGEFWHYLISRKTA